MALCLLEQSGLQFCPESGCGAELGAQHTLGVGQGAPAWSRAVLMPSLTREPSFVQKQADSLGGCEQKATRLACVLKGLTWSRRHKSCTWLSLHRAGDLQLGLLIICMENVILCHVAAQRVSRAQQLGSWGQRSFGVQNRIFFLFEDEEKCSQMEP